MIKPQLYEQAGIPHYLRIEQGESGCSAVAYHLQRGRYIEQVRADPGLPLVLTQPFAVTLDLTALAAATRPPGPAAQ